MLDVLFKAFFAFWEDSLFPAALLLFALQVSLLRASRAGFRLVGPQLLGDGFAFLLLLLGCEGVFQLLAVRLLLFLAGAGATAWLGVESVRAGVRDEAQMSLSSSSAAERAANRKCFLLGLLLRFTMSANFYWWSGAGAAQLHQAQEKTGTFGIVLFALGLLLACFLAYGAAALLSHMARRWMKPFAYRVLAFACGGCYGLAALSYLAGAARLIF